MRPPEPLRAHDSKAASLVNVVGLRQRIAKQQTSLETDAWLRCYVAFCAAQRLCTKTAISHHPHIRLRCTQVHQFPQSALDISLKTYYTNLGTFSSPNSQALAMKTGLECWQGPNTGNPRHNGGRKQEHCNLTRHPNRTTPLSVQTECSWLPCVEWWLGGLAVGCN